MISRLYLHEKVRLYAAVRAETQMKRISERIPNSTVSGSGSRRVRRASYAMVGIQHLSRPTAFE
jgi:hypothetical protein